MNRRVFLAVAAGSGLSALGCRDYQSRRPTEAMPALKLLFSASTSGTARAESEAVANALQLAIGESQSILPEYRLDCVVRDNTGANQLGWNAESEQQNAREALADADVMMYLGPLTTGAARVSMPILNEGGLLQLAPTCTWPGLTKRIHGDQSGEPDIYRRADPGKLSFGRVCPTDLVQGGVAAAFARDDIGVRKVYILHDRELYGRTLADAFHQQCMRSGVQVLGSEGVDTSQKDFSGILNRIKSLTPDLLYYGGTSQSKGGQIARDMVSETVKCPLIVPEGCHDETFVDALAEARFGDRCYTTVPGIDPSVLTGDGAAFAAKYRARFRATPNLAALYGFETAMVFLETVKRARRTEREAIRQACFESTEFRAGILGPWRFDADGDTTLQAATVYRVSEREFIAVKSITNRLT
jgi:branched-chain amino acid transport system substrate-binding protein